MPQRITFTASRSHVFNPNNPKSTTFQALASNDEAISALAAADQAVADAEVARTMVRVQAVGVLARSGLSTRESGRLIGWSKTAVSTHRKAQLGVAEISEGAAALIRRAWKREA